MSGLATMTLPLVIPKASPSEAMLADLSLAALILKNCGENSNLVVVLPFFSLEVEVLLRYPANYPDFPLGFTAITDH
jgi:hypothetical protein